MDTKQKAYLELSVAMAGKPVPELDFPYWELSRLAF
jgi:hypothetical protein